MSETRPYIVLIDDDQDDLEMLNVLLEEHGVRTRIFESGYSAISFFENGKDFAEFPSLIIVDYNMPLINGLDTLIRIKELENVNHIPVVIYSTTVNQLLIRTAREFGAYGCECKSVSLTDLRKKSAYFADLARSFSEKSFNYGRAFGW
jgi:two-component system chemotaxis response regulator CheY